MWIILPPTPPRLLMSHSTGQLLNSIFLIQTVGKTATHTSFRVSQCMSESKWSLWGAKRQSSGVHAGLKAQHRGRKRRHGLGTRMGGNPFFFCLFNILINENKITNEPNWACAIKITLRPDEGFVCEDPIKPNSSSESPRPNILQNVLLVSLFLR